MPSYRAPVTDMRFLLNEVWPIEKCLADINCFQEINQDLSDTILAEAAKLSSEVLQPINQSGDRQGCRYLQGNVTTPDGFKQAYQTFRENGWVGITADTEHGGQGLPQMLGLLCEEMFASANVSLSLYPGLTSGVAKAVKAHASTELQNIYLPKLISGEWSAVMCLTESHAGSDLSLLRTKAVANSDGSYNISGTKIFITAGEHDLTENIVHLVLARTPEAPAGIKGISVFLVPKFLIKPDGSLGERNPVFCGSIEHKMGLKGSSTCVMNYDNARGYLVGELYHGVNAMFTVMNIERLSIGLQGLALAECAYQNALAYAQERLQGRAATGALFPEKPADPIIVHADVRRMLLTIKAQNEGARALLVWAAQQADISHHHADANKRQRANDLLELFTPIVKAYFTDYGFNACNLALQVLGGHGYISEWGLEQFVRDARISQLYEGTNGIQAQDLVRRKLIANKGAHLQIFIEEAESLLSQLSGLTHFATSLRLALDTLQSASKFILKNHDQDANLMGSSACDYLHLFALTALTFSWCQMARVAHGKSDDFHQAKLITGDFFIHKLLPQIQALHQSIVAGSDSVMKLPAAWF